MKQLQVDWDQLTLEEVPELPEGLVGLAIGVVVTSCWDCDR